MKKLNRFGSLAHDLTNWGIELVLGKTRNAGFELIRQEITILRKIAVHTNRIELVHAEEERVVAFGCTQEGGLFLDDFAQRRRSELTCFHIIVKLRARPYVEGGHDDELRLRFVHYGCVGKCILNAAPSPCQTHDQVERERNASVVETSKRLTRLVHCVAFVHEREHIVEPRLEPDVETRVAKRRQLGKLNDLVDKLGTVGIFDGEDMKPEEIPVSEFLCAALDRKADEFASLGLTVTADVAPGVTLSADPEGIKRMIDEIIDNALEYSLTRASFRLNNENGAVLLETQNDTSLPDGPADQVFDHFTVLENAKEGSAGLGLSYVKETVKALNGRASARVADGVFTLRITI